MPSLKEVLIGKPISSEEQEHQRLRKLIALPIFSSDAISSTAYATDEILVVLLLQAGIGYAAFNYLVPDRHRRVRADGDRRAELSADDPCLPVGRRRVRRQPREPRHRPVAGRRIVIARRLHPHRGGQRRRRCAGNPHGHRFRQQVDGARLPAVRRRHDGRQPARRQRERRSLRRADVLLHPDADHPAGDRPLSRLRPARRPDPRQPAVRRRHRDRQGDQLAQPVHVATRVLVGRRGLVGCRGRLERCALVQEAGEQERGDDAGVDGHHPRCVLLRRVGVGFAPQAATVVRTTATVSV